ncbi:uncharacterized protein LOC118648358 isoform X2 [Monomorium pharaonis]|uniref:uncharacterized protein LOC118648358 isoform X2 n=1 Tax=Monomorium pharaonis TaxID=307658 RepID=UPI001745F89F|nr:uncharacterized protein LOC118648358 isoform X2 [Monomorium pharaonis]
MKGNMSVSQLYIMSIDLRMAFYVLLYDVYCITVPTIWIDFERSIFKMPKKSKQLTQACIKQMPPCDDWDELTFHKSFGPYETYQNARSVEKVVGEMSASDDNINNINIQAYDKCNASKKRLIKKRKLYGDTSNEDEPKKMRLKLPSNYIPQVGSGYVSDLQPKINKAITKPGSCESSDLNQADDTPNSDNTFDSNSLLEEIQYSNTETQKAITNCGHKQKSYKTVKEIPKTVKTNCVGQEKASTAQPKIMSADNTEEFGNEIWDENLGNQSNDLEHTCCGICRRGINAKLAILERKLNRIIHLYENKQEVQNEREVQVVDFSLLPNLPLTTVERIEAFNNQLDRADVRRQFIQKMSQVGGETVAKNVRNIMSQTIGYEVAQAYTWTGQKNKLSLRKSRLSDTIIETVLMQGKSTVSEIEKCMQEWLRRSGDRIRAILLKK